MCGRYVIAQEKASPVLNELLCDLEARLREKQPGFSIRRGEIRPGDMAPVLALNRNMNMQCFMMQWGYHLGKKLVFNARSETASQKPLFREGMSCRRCLIPASAYIEWDHSKQKPPKLMFWPKGLDMMYLAGVYRFEEDQKPVFTILTREAAAEIHAIHGRMPLVIPQKLAAAWLDHEQDPRMIASQALMHMDWTEAE